MTNEELWQATLGEIELSISKANFITWFKNTTILSNENGKIVIGVPNGFSKEWLENKYNTYILKALRNLNGDVKEISCIIYNPQEAPFLNRPRAVDAVKGPSFHKKDSNQTSTPGHFLSNNSESNLNPRYTFENFIVGENNELAKAACYAVSQNLGRAYNPLFVYGGVGLGKTHLLQSIGNEINKTDSSKKILYITSERFANNLIESIKSQKTSQFKDEYQKIDLLIIDDIQFLSGKEKTQHEFFHIFNALYQLNKQIVISSDRPPKSIAALEERLRSRFEGGMIVDVIRPDLETRIAILKAKISEKGFFIEDEVVRFVAENIKNNIRELEGALNKIIASCELERKDPDIHFVKKALADIISSNKKRGVQIKNIVDVVAEFYNIPLKDLINKGRKKEVAIARQVAIYLIRSELNISYPGIGEFFGGRDHTTALHAYEKISVDIKTDNKLVESLSVLKEKIYTI